MVSKLKIKKQGSNIHQVAAGMVLSDLYIFIVVILFFFSIITMVSYHSHSTDEETETWRAETGILTSISNFENLKSSSKFNKHLSW